MITVSQTNNIDALKADLDRYYDSTSKSRAEAVKSKINDLGLALFRGFYAHRFGAGQKKPALAELRQRAASGRGLKLRPELAAKFRSERAKLSTARRSVGQLVRKSRNGTLTDWENAQGERSALKKVKAKMWGRFVKSELGRRNSSSGFLGVAFLWAKNRAMNQGGMIGSSDRQGRLQGRALINQDGSAIIEGYTVGQGIVDARYGIVSGAIGAVRADIHAYLLKKAQRGLKGGAS